MKNSAVNTAKSVAVDTVKFIVYPAHFVAQTTADLLNLGQAKAINAIDGTPVMESMYAQETWTQKKQLAVVSKYMEVKERIEKQRESNRKQDIARIKKTLDKLEGVEHITEPNPVINITVTEPENTAKATTVPAPPKATRQSAMSKAIKKAEATPLMTAPAPPVAQLV